MTPMIMFLMVAARGILGGRWEGDPRKQIYRFFFSLPPHFMVNMTAFTGTRIIHQPGVCDEKNNTQPHSGHGGYLRRERSHKPCCEEQLQA